MPPKEYQGNCHCGLIKYTLTLPEALAPEGTGQIIRCNCSICVKNGYYLVYPQISDVHFTPGSFEKMSSYLMGKKTKPHRFCPECSSSVLIDFSEAEDLPKEWNSLYAMNAALFKDIDLERASIKTTDGKNKLEPAYEEP
ncbi:hypothetical protein LTR62_006345 [Meristemomyces frigidus]|uniref:CENP-V/GFA domain-containing protein n=1 Tax=Meristemomyces frigidus TaxID=1508187 RepID=A0AAN7YEJ5_9PEZI|nr:hypothetical protein LTR62_006345 [Meristemomyces frigidus]